MMHYFNNTFGKLFFLCVCVFALALPAHSQNTTGSIVGTVTDGTGASVPNATVTITNEATGEKRNTVSSDNGDYQALTLVPGLYTIDISASGFKRYVRNAVQVLVEQASRINAQMTIGAVTDQVTITSSAPIMQSENASLGQVVEGRVVTEMPLNGRNVLALVGLVPGVVPQGSSGGNLTGQNVFAAGNFQIGGGSANQSSTLVDGAPVNISYGNITSLVPSQDVVQEFKVQTSNNTAEYGMYTGGVINMTTKSGSNSIHGTAYEFVRNTVFNATPFFNRHTSTILPKSPYQLNQFGGNVGFPIIRDKLWGFFDYQGYRQRVGVTRTYTVPTPLQRAGNFSEFTNPIYDPCGGTVTVGGQGCPNYTGPRTAFAGNIIPASRFSKVAVALLNTKFPGSTGTVGYYILPNVKAATASGYALTNNWVGVAHAGGNNDQYTGRVDFALSQKQRLFGRYTQWGSGNIGANTYGNGLIGGDPISPEAFTTRQIVFGDTYVPSSSLVADLRLSYLRWTYVRTPGTLGYDETQLGFPSYMGSISALNNVVNSTTVPGIGIANPTYSGVGSGYIFGTNQDYVIAPSVSKTIKSHTIKAGADLRRLEMLYFQNNSPGGSFQFDPNMTASAGSGATGNSGNPFASFMLGYMVNQANTASVVQIAPPTYTQMYYQGYYVQDNWVATSKLTVNFGLRYEIPGVWRERHELLATFNPTEINPVLGAISINGTPVLGAYDLVGTPQHPDLGLRPEHFTNFSPRLGLAFRATDKTVLRAGWGKFVIPADLQFPESAAQSPLSYITNNPVTTLNNGGSPSNTLDNPLPSGLTPAPGRSPKYQQLLLGGPANTLLQNEDNGATYQWNFAIQRELPKGITMEVAYAGLHGSHLPVSLNINQVSASILAQAHSDPNCFVNASTAPTANCFLTKTVPNPFPNYATNFTAGSQQYSTISSTKLYQPFPQYGSINNTGHYVGFSNYTALQAKVEKRFNSGGQILGAYTFSKLMANAESLTSWLETVGAPGYQNTNDLGHEYSLSGYDSRQRLTVSYVYNLPFGRGQHWAAGVSGFTDKLVSGWGFNGVTLFQEGYPMGISSSTGYVATYSGTGSTRPNVVQGCNKRIGGPIQKRLGDINSSVGNNPYGGAIANPYFNVSCFVSPDRFTFGNESRTDNALRLPGVANWDLALFKETHVTERVSLVFRVESFNLFNRVQFGGPNSSVGGATNGQITTQANEPRELQLAARLKF